MPHSVQELWPPVPSLWVLVAGFAIIAESGSWAVAGQQGCIEA